MRTLALRAPFGAAGLFAGLAAACLLLPDGCAITASQSLRLRALVPVVTPLIVLGIAQLVRARRLRAVIPLLLGGQVVLAAAIGLIYDGLRGLAVIHLVLLYLAPLFIGLPLVLFLVYLQARQEAARAHRAAYVSARLMIWMVALTAVSALAPLLWAVNWKPIDRPLAWMTIGLSFTFALVNGALAARVRKNVARAYVAFGLSVGTSLLSLAVLRALPTERATPHQDIAPLFWTPHC